MYTQCACVWWMSFTNAYADVGRWEPALQARDLGRELVLSEGIATVAKRRKKALL